MSGMMLALSLSLLAAAPGVTVDPLTRYIHIEYTVPADAPEAVAVTCEWRTPDAPEAAWRPAKVTPLLGETGLALASDDEWRAWQAGHVVERRAAGLVRTVVWNPYPEAAAAGRVDCEFRVLLAAEDGRALGESLRPVQSACADVVMVEDWNAVVQQGLLAAGEEAGWHWKTGDAALSRGDGLFGDPYADRPLPPVSRLLDLRGTYALFVCTPAGQGVRLRLTGDERSDTLASRRAGEEVLWRWVKMDRQGLVVGQPYGYKGYSPAALDYVKLVPLPEAEAARLDEAFGTPDKFVAGYFEPYSWAFVEDVRETRQHMEPLMAFDEARISLVDIQIGRFGMKSVFETRKTDPLLYATIGDPVEGDAQPRTDNVGKMQQYTNTLETELRYAQQLGMTPHANFGASNCYPGSPLQGDFSKAHPEWMRGSALRYEVPEVRAYALGLYREALEIGAPGLSLDFCRYPETIDSAETCNLFLAELRALADKMAAQRGRPVPILVRFPATGVRRNEFFDYAAWARNGWVDYICPSNIQGRHHHYDIQPYITATAGTKSTLLPCIDGLGWGPEMPGPFLWRVASLYDAGVAGLYVYQADARILGQPTHRRCMRLLASGEGVRRWWDNERQQQPRRSKGIYLPRAEAPGGKWSKYERLRPWVEGIAPGAMECYLDGTLVNRCDGPPYMLGTENYDSDGVIPAGEHQLRLRAQDGDGWLEQTFTITGG